MFDTVHVEPTAGSLQEAADFAVEGGFDGFVAVGGGSSIDTAKVADLVSSHPAPIMEYVNAPVGEGRTPPRPLKPLLAIPTTSGTGSEATTVAILDIPDQKVKTGISHRCLRPHQGIVDPELTKTLPAEVTSSCGLDVVCHAAESFLSRPYHTRDRPESPDERPPRPSGANPVSDLWSARALEYGGKYLRRAVADSDDTEARGAMMLAATLAGIGFGSAGVQHPHSIAYPVASLKHQYQPPGYDIGHPFVPHGWSVIVSAPAAFPVHLRGRPRQAPAGGRAAGRRADSRRGREHSARRADPADRRRAGAQRHTRARVDEDDIEAVVEGALKRRQAVRGLATSGGPGSARRDRR